MVEDRMPRYWDIHRAVWGITIITVGVVLLLANWVGGYGAWGLLWRLWPVQFIAIGLAKVFASKPGRRHSGYWLLFFGIWLLLAQLNFINAGTFWPLLMVAAGVGMALKAVPYRFKTE